MVFQASVWVAVVKAKAIGVMTLMLLCCSDTLGSVVCVILVSQEAKMEIMSSLSGWHLHCSAPSLGSLLDRRVSSKFRADSMHRDWIIGHECHVAPAEDTTAGSLLQSEFPTSQINHRPNPPFPFRLLLLQGRIADKNVEGCRFQQGSHLYSGREGVRENSLLDDGSKLLLSTSRPLNRFTPNQRTSSSVLAPFSRRK